LILEKRFGAIFVLATAPLQDGDCFVPGTFLDSSSPLNRQLHASRRDKTSFPMRRSDLPQGTVVVSEGAPAAAASSLSALGLLILEESP
jgi:hypothetical protein